MRSAKTSLRNSLFGWLLHDESPTPDARMETIRKAMLRALEQTDGSTDGALEKRLLLAGDIEELWYARPDLMSAISASQSESVARDCLASITGLFDGLQPGGRQSAGRAR